MRVEKLMRSLFVSVFAVVALALSGCHSVKPDAGHEAVLVRKPWFFGRGGVGDEAVRAGLKWVALSTSDIVVNVQPAAYEEQFEDLMSSDGVPLDFHTTLVLQVTDSVKLIREFGPKWYLNNVNPEYRNRVRQAVRKHGLNEMAISATAVDEVDNEVSAGIEAYLISIKIPVRFVRQTVGRANPPDAIENQRVETAREQQRIQTEESRQRAEVQRKEAELARAEADNAYRNEMTLNPEQFIELENLKMLREVCAKEGKCTFFLGASGPTPTVAVR